MWSAWSEQAKTALERTGDAISKAATHAARASRQPPPSTTATSTSSSLTTTTTTARETQSNEASGATTTATASTSTAQPIQDGNTTGLTQPELVVFRSIQAGWTNVVNQTKASIKTAQELAHEQQHRFLQHLHEQELQQRRRDPTIPLDVPALRDAEVVYVTDRLISMSHPNMASTTDGSITAERKLVAVEHLLHRRHAGRYMIWNVSEVEYDADLFHNQVLTFHFPGSPSPPLGLLLKLLISMEAWLKADDRNVAVVHCLTGKGRTSTVLAAFLCWMGQAGFGNMVAALQYMAACKKTTLDDLVIPSQRRYATYFSNMLDGVRPSQPPLVLQRIILSTAPRFAKGPPREYVNNNNNNSSSSKDGVISTTATSTDESQLWGCCPYMQLFKAGHLLYTAPAVRNTQQQQQQPQPTSGATATATTAINTASSSDELVFCQVADGSIRFEINQVVQGDILIRCRHIKLIAGSRKPVRVSMFRAAFHTGYVPPTVMRLTKQQLDGACHDDRFLDDFYIDLIFGPADAGHVSAILRQQDQEQQHQQQVSSTDAVTTVSAIDGQQDITEQPIATEISDAATPPMESPSNSNESNNKNSSNMVVSASSDDSMLHRDSRFWDVIQVRRHEKAAAAQAHQDTISSSSNAISAEEVVSFNQQQQQQHHHHQAAMMGDDMWGPTVGRRRTFEKNRHQQAGKTDGTVTKSDEMPLSASTSSASSSKPSALETFSIGHELDFLPTVNETTTPPPAVAVAVAITKSAATVKSSTTTTTAKPHDSLMEALMGALDDDDDDHDTEEVIFFEGKDEEADPPANNINTSSMNFRPTIVALPPLPVTATTATTISTSNEVGAPNDSGTNNNKEIAVPAVAAATSGMIDVRSLMPHTNKDVGGRTVTDSAVGETQSVLDSDTIIRSSGPSAEEILATANMNLDDDVNALLGTSNNNNDDDDDDDDDDALVNLDDDDDDLQDLENMLSSVK